MIEIDVDGETNKGKILLATILQATLESRGFEVEWPLDEFESESKRLEYALKSHDKQDLEGIKIVIKTIKR